MIIKALTIEKFKGIHEPVRVEVVMIAEEIQKCRVER